MMSNQCRHSFPSLKPCLWKTMLKKTEQTQMAMAMVKTTKMTTIYWMSLKKSLTRTIRKKAKVCSPGCFNVSSNSGEQRFPLAATAYAGVFKSNNKVPIRQAAFYLPGRCR